MAITKDNLEAAFWEKHDKLYAWRISVKGIITPDQEALYNKAHGLLHAELDRARIRLGIKPDRLRRGKNNDAYYESAKLDIVISEKTLTSKEQEDLKQLTDVTLTGEDFGG